MPDSLELPGRRKWLQWCYLVLKRWVLIPLAAMLVATLVLGRIVSWVVKPDSYKVYFAGPFSDPTAKEPTERIWTALEAGNPSLGTLEGVPVILKRLDDFADPAIAERLSRDVAQRHDTLLVIGHVYSTQTRAALPAYLQVASPPIPVILTTETNPDLLPPNGGGQGDFAPVYRLSATDDLQAGLAACFAKTQNAKAIWVVEAGPNRVYSRYLAQVFIERVQTERDRKVLLWSSSLDRPVSDAIKALNIDWVFFAGDWQNALVLIRQLKAGARDGKLPGIILSDAAMDSRLLDQGKTDMDGVYLTFPVPFQRFTTEEGYAVYGKDARALATNLINKTAAEFNSLAGEDGGTRRTLNRWLGLKRAADARQALRNLMRHSVEHHDEFLLGPGVRVRFGPQGVPEGRPFSIWQARDSKFTGVETACTAPAGAEPGP